MAYDEALAGRMRRAVGRRAGITERKMFGGLAFLFNRFERRVALTVPSYNAGEGATGRWLKQRGDWAVDEFAEEIPYDETRLYSKRVIATYFAYSFLSDGSIPEMPNDIPKSLVP